MKKAFAERNDSIHLFSISNSKKRGCQIIKRIVIYANTMGFRNVKRTKKWYVMVNYWGILGAFNIKYKINLFYFDGRVQKVISRAIYFRYISGVVCHICNSDTFYVCTICDLIFRKFK